MLAGAQSMKLYGLIFIFTLTRIRAALDFSRFDFSPTFYKEASNNLSDWRTSLIVKVYQQYSDASKHAFTHLNRKVEDIGVGVETHGHGRYKIFSPFVSCPKTLRRHGSEDDGGKWLCGVESLREPCSIISLGSHGQFDFEEAMLRITPCKVYTFDCTSRSKTLGVRHEYFKFCIGSTDDLDRSFVTLDKAVQLTGGITPSLLKMDIEGGEFNILPFWDRKYKHLPEQLSFEVHYANLYAGTKHFRNASSDGDLIWAGIKEVSLAQLSLMFLHLANLGYAIVSREENVRCGNCVEFTMMRVEIT